MHMMKILMPITTLREWFHRREIIGLIIAISVVALLIALGFWGVSRVEGFHLAGG
ncbi:hypothetical protein PT277_01305 [Acetobacteraceae bacterium ESL0709]|nr:hypothetical protein [Acetobacteraceae bacterium ESL0697]MDF7677339.1 hypothetical protein [Acetobacteraceae bacterium ESL0709]